MAAALALLIAASSLAPPELRLPADARPAPEDAAAVARRALAVAARGDPPVRALQEAAARSADPAAADRGAIARSRWAALIPRVAAEVRVDERTYRVVGLQSSGEVDYAHYAPGRSAALTATWDLAALLSPPAERTTPAALLARARRRDEAVRRVTALYYERRRLRLALELQPAGAPAEQAVTLLEIERLGAELDALTGGALTGGGR